MPSELFSSVMITKGISPQADAVLEKDRPIKVPASIHREIKACCAMHDEDMGDVVADLWLNRHLIRLAEDSIRNAVSPEITQDELRYLAGALRLRRSQDKNCQGFMIAVEIVLKQL